MRIRLRHRRVFQRLPCLRIDGHIGIDLRRWDNRLGMWRGFRIALNPGVNLGRRQRRHQAWLLRLLTLRTGSLRRTGPDPVVRTRVVPNDAKQCHGKQ
jgi:hypothetical protein